MKSPEQLQKEIEELKILLEKTRRQLQLALEEVVRLSEKLEL
jgi:hypothetical protein